MISIYRRFNVKLVAPIYFEQIKLSKRYLFNLIQYFIAKIVTPVKKMKIEMAGFGYGANLSAVVYWDSKTFWRRPWESRLRLFFLERSNVILSNWLLFSRVWFIYQEWDLILTGSTVVLPCASVRTAPLCSLNASAVRAMIAEGSDRNSLMLLSKHGVRPRRHLWFFRKFLQLAHAIGWSDGRLCCRCSHRLIDNFGMWRLYRVYAPSFAFVAR